MKNHLIVGIISDDDATSYKRKPIYNEENRKILVEYCMYVDEIITNAPLILTEKFINDNNIDLVCHGFLNKDDEEKQKSFLKSQYN